MKIEDLILEIGQRSPFYLYLLLTVSKRPSDKVRTIALSFSKKSNPMLVYNPRWLQKKDRNILKGMLIHEILHLVSLHFLIRPKDERDKKIWDLAMDASINQYIPELAAFGIPLDVLVREGHGVDNENFFVVPPDSMPGLSAEEYHKWIIEEMEKLGRYDVLEVAEIRGKATDSHKAMYEIDTSVDMILELTKSKVGKAFDLYKNELPSGIRRLVQISISQPLLNWRDMMRRFIGITEQGERYMTPLRPNRRYEMQPGWRMDYTARIGVVVDTSGSIIDEELNAFLSEIDAMSRLSGSDIVLIQVDRTVNLEMRYRHGMWRKMEIIGGGETDLQPAVNRIQEKYRTEGIVVFTDGFTELPSVSRRVLFVLSKHSNEEFAKQALEAYGKNAVVFLK